MVLTGFRKPNSKLRTAFEEAGVKAGDVLIAVQSVSVKGLSYDEIVSMIGAAMRTGRTISLKFQRACSYSFKFTKKQASDSKLYDL